MGDGQLLRDVLGERGALAACSRPQRAAHAPPAGTFLISRDQEGAFDSKVKSIAGKFDKLTFKYTGPWPPYNFVNIRLKLERA